LSAAATSHHQIDGGRSRAVHDSLEPLLREVRAHLRADLALVVYESFSGERDICVLAASAAADIELPIANEPLTLSHGQAAMHPTALQDLVLQSTVRRYRLELATALLVPWRDASGRGWLIVGHTPRSWNRGALDLGAANTFLPRLRMAHEIGGLAGTVQLQGDVAEAIRIVAEASVELQDVPAILEAVVFAAKMMLGTEVAYISLPDDDPDIFQFSTLLGIKTSAFRRLRVRRGEGLGGFTREQLRTVRSMNYAQDGRLRHAPVEETLREGILSAMCTPLTTGRNVIGLLYVGNRHLTPFTETDAALIEELAGHATLGIRHAQAEQYRTSVMRRREQERLAARLHDSVVRSLMQIGFQAEDGLTIPGDPALRHRFAIISKAAEYCLETLREHLAELTSDDTRDSISVGEMVEAVRSAHWRESVELRIELANTVASAKVPYAAALTLVRIGQEAVDNAQLHSDCTRCRVTLRMSADTAQLVAEDDGRGMTNGEISRMLHEESRHLGLRGMRAAAKAAGGRITIGPGAEGGLSIDALVPLHPFSDVDA
jgi:signal transduction histidine kinase